MQAAPYISRHTTARSRIAHARSGSRFGDTSDESPSRDGGAGQFAVRSRVGCDRREASKKVTETSQSLSAKYRAEAERVRQEAGTVRDRDARQMLIDIAAQYERLAALHARLFESGQSN